MTLQGRVLAGRYALGAQVGVGGMGQVYRARDRVLERTVAVKVLSAASAHDLELVARFGREARAAAALNHPNIVAVFDSGADGDLHYLVMEYVEGQSLAGLLRRAVAARHVTEQPMPPSHRNPRVGPALEAVVLTALAKEPADRYQSAAAMAQDLDQIATDADAGDMPLPGPHGGPPTDWLPSVTATSSAATAKTASPALRRPGWIPWALVGTIGVVALVVALWPRGGDPPASPQATTVPTAAPPTRPAGTTSPTRPQVELPAALANLSQVISTGRQEGTIDNSAEDLLKQAQEALRTAQEGKGEDADKKLQGLQRKTDEQVDKGKIRGPAVDQVRQAVAQFGQAVRSR
jgi:serine/threonine protein kinase